MRTLGKSRQLVLAIGALAAARVAATALLPFMDKTEGTYADMARRMAELGDYVTPWFEDGVPFFGKPPLVFWTTAGSFELFGFTELAGRLPAVAFSLATAWLTWRLARAAGREVGLLAVLVLCTTPVFLVCAGTVMTDPGLVAGTTLAMTSFWLVVGSERPTAWPWSYGLFAGLALALLAKGPVGLVIIGLPLAAWTLMTGRLWHVLQTLPWVRGVLLVSILVVPWYARMEQQNPGFIDYFLVGEHWLRFTDPAWSGDRYGSAHERPLGWVWVYWVTWAAPWSVVALALLARAWTRRAMAATPPWAGLTGYLLLWALTPLVLFTFSRNLLWTYMLPGAPAWAALVAILGSSGDETPAAHRVIRVLGTTMAVAVAAAAPLLLLDPAGHRSEKHNIAAYRARLDESPGARLHYLWHRPGSAQFYNAGGVGHLEAVEDLEAALEADAVDFVAVPRSRYCRVPEALRARLHPVRTADRYWLFDTRGPDGATVDATIGQTCRPPSTDP